jgi:hypothetical protein
LDYSGTATAFDDYRTIDETIPDAVEIPPGASSVALDFYAPDDSEPETTETAIISILPDPAYNLGYPTHSALYVLDNDLGILHALRNDDGSLSLTWATESSVRYRVCYKDQLSQAQWVPLSDPLLAGSDTLTWIDRSAGSAGQRFYLIERLR